MIRDQRDVKVVALPLVEVDGKLLFPNDLREPARGGDGARRERGEARGVDAAHLAGLADHLTVAVHHEDALGVRVLHEPLRDRQNLAEILVEHHELCIVHRQSPR